MQKLELSKPVVDAVIAYLGQQPYQDVHTLLNALSQELAPQLHEDASKDSAKSKKQP
jgi:hypothetical protein